MTLSQILFKLRKDNGYTQPQVAAFLCEHGINITYKAISKWENSDTTPDAKQFLVLCELYGIRDVLALFSGLSPQDPLAALNAEGRARVEEYIELLSTDERFTHPHIRKAAPKRGIPLYDLPVSAGTGSFLDGDSYELLEPDSTVPTETTFAVRIFGDSMSPRFVDGQIIYVKQQPTLEDGETGIFMLNGSAYCKRLLGGRLISINPKYAPITIGNFDDFRIYGKVLA